MRRLARLLALLIFLSGCAAVQAEDHREEAPPPSVEEAPEPPEEIPEKPAEPPEESEPPEPLDEEFVKVMDYIPDIAVELRYAGENNFTGQVIYDFTDACLRYGTVKRLAAVQAALSREGLGLKIWDAFRPPAAQFKLWEICLDSRYVANHNKGFSSHSRGNTVDLTLVDGEGNELPMPTGFDDFSAKADRDYSDVSPEKAENARRLEDAMVSQGFKPYAGEWWHFSDMDGYPVEEDFLPPHQETLTDSALPHA